ncbi:MAG: AbrB/MazE/SpoVT family DNA-binding domain-containing protein [bacterium]
MSLVRMSTKGQIVIPKVVREKLGLKPNSRIKLELFEDHAEISALPDYVQELRGILKDKPSMTEDLLREHGNEVKADEGLLIRVLHQEPESEG